MNLSALNDILPSSCILTSEEELLVYSSDATRLEYRPDVVVKPENAGQVCELLRWATANRVPVTPRGAGSGLSGGALAVRGGILLSFEAMNRILDIDRENLLVTLEPGVITAALHQAVEAEGFFYPPDPGSMKMSTIGGNIAENAGGPRGLKYGVTRDYVMALDTVLAGGSSARFGSRTVKCVTGYDMRSLMVGSEGTLGVVTEATLRLIPKPESLVTFLAVYHDADQAARAVAEIIRRGIIPTTLEFIDRYTIDAVENWRPGAFPAGAGAVLLIELDGFESEVRRQTDILEALLRETGAGELRRAADNAEREALWLGRRSAFAALARMKPSTIAEDATVPRGRIPDMVRGIRRIAERYNLIICTFGHAGDGNLHPTIAADLRNPDEAKRVEAAVADIFKVALELGGTLSGEHGIGIAKAPFMKNELSETSLSAMKSVKHALDPHDILNPGKIF